MEYFSSNAHGPSPDNFLYGPGSKAWSVTVTPTYVWNRFFIRPELSVVVASHITPGIAFGADGNARSQWRGRLEAGVMF